MTHATDIRIKLSLRTHPKWVRLRRRCGADGQVALLMLWLWCGEHRPDGVLRGLDDADVEDIAAGWSGEPGTLLTALLELGWVERSSDGLVTLHDWVEHNGWAAGSADRSASGRNAAILGARAKTNTPLPMDVWSWLTPKKQRQYWRIAPPEVHAEADTYAEWRRRHRQRPSQRHADGSAPYPTPSPTPTPTEGGTGGGSGSGPPSLPVDGSVGPAPSLVSLLRTTLAFGGPTSDLEHAIRSVRDAGFTEGGIRSRLADANGQLAGTSPASWQSALLAERRRSASTYRSGPQAIPPARPPASVSEMAQAAGMSVDAYLEAHPGMRDQLREAGLLDEGEEVS